MASKRIVLLVEDDIDLLDVMHDILTAHFDTVIKAPDGISAYLAVKSVKPDFVIADIKMPGMSGIDFVAKIRAEGMLTPVILCSAHPGVEELKKAMSLGVADYVEKPFTIEVMETAVFRMLEIQKKMEEIQKLKLSHGSYSDEVRNKERIVSRYQAANAARNSK